MESSDGWRIATARSPACMPAIPHWPHGSEMKKLNLTLIADSFIFACFDSEAKHKVACRYANGYLRGGSSAFPHIVTQLGTEWSKRLPAQKTGGRYKTCHQQRLVVL